MALSWKNLLTNYLVSFVIVTAIYFLCRAFGWTLFTSVLSAFAVAFVFNVLYRLRQARHQQVNVAYLKDHTETVEPAWMTALEPYEINVTENACYAKAQFSYVVQGVAITRTFYIPQRTPQVFVRAITAHHQKRFERKVMKCLHRMDWS